MGLASKNTHLADAERQIGSPHKAGMTVGRTEVPLTKGPLPQKPAPIVQADDAPHLTPRAKIGAGSYEDPVVEKKCRGRPKKANGRGGNNEVETDQLNRLKKLEFSF